MKEWIRNHVINVKDYGAVGDGETDDSEALLAAKDALPLEYGVLYFPPGIYLHGDGIVDDTSDPNWDGVYRHTGNGFRSGYSVNHYAQFLDEKYIENGQQKDAVSKPAKNGGLSAKLNGVSINNKNLGRAIILNFTGYKNLTIFGNSAEIRSNDNNGDCNNNAIFQFNQCENLTIKNLILDGRRQQRGVWLGDTSGYSRRGNLGIRYCTNVKIENIESKNSAMDGLVLGHAYSNINGQASTSFPSKDIFVSNCKFLSNHRQGISIVGAQNVVIENCILGDTGTSNLYPTDGSHPYRGTNPKDGIDIQANSNSAAYINKNVIIRHCEFYNNKGIYSIQEIGKCENITVDSCIFRDKGLQIGSGQNQFTKISNVFNNVFYITDLASRPALFIKTGGKVQNNMIFYNSYGSYYNAPSTTTSNMQYAIYSTNVTNEPLIIQNNIIKCNVDDLKNSVAKNVGLCITNPYAIFRNNVFINPLWGGGDRNPVKFPSYLSVENNLFIEPTRGDLVTDILPSNYNWTYTLLDSEIIKNNSWKIVTGSVEIIEEEQAILDQDYSDQEDQETFRDN